jgi:hypothetical protein
MHNFLNGTALKANPIGPGLLGVMAAPIVSLAIAAALVVSLKRPRTGNIVRVAGI